MVCHLLIPFHSTVTTCEKVDSCAIHKGSGILRSLCHRSLLIFPRWRVRHFHINTAFFKFLKHLIKPFFFRFLKLRIVYPTDVVILLIRRALLVFSHQTTFFQCLLDKIWHWMSGTFQPRTLLLDDLVHSFPLTANGHA